ncbi:MAG: DUF1326 domain-containing protein [Propionibacteriales bacterium]|nr:DUF1326 domain-containing protein [Propionibacteriales bacterium]
MPWHLNGTYFENCNCDMICPCTHSGFSAAADYDRCRALLAFHVSSGEVDEVDVSGLNFAMFIDSPPVMADGDWRLGLFLDAAASPAQAEKFGAVLSGGLGGPPAMLGPLIGEMMGVDTVPIVFEDDGGRHRVRIGDQIAITVQDYVPPGSDAGPVQISNVVHPANSTLTVARAVESRVSAFGVGFDAEGQSAFSAPFAWSA